jgi:hypothetical protein
LLPHCCLPSRDSQQGDNQSRNVADKDHYHGLLIWLLAIYCLHGWWLSVVSAHVCFGRCANGAARRVLAREQKRRLCYHFWPSYSNISQLNMTTYMRNLFQKENSTRSLVSDVTKEDEPPPTRLFSFRQSKNSRKEFIMIGVSEFDAIVSNRSGDIAFQTICKSDKCSLC